MSASTRTAEPLFAGLFYLGAARVSMVCMNLVATSVLAHRLGTENFGLNSFAISYLSYFMIVVNLGYETFLTREIAYDSTHLRRLVESMISMRLLLAAGSWLLLAASLWLLDLPPLGRVVVLIQSLNLFSSAIGLSCIYQGLQRMRIVAGREFFASLINMTGMICLVHSPGDVVIAAAVSAGTFALTNIPILVQYWTDFGRPRLRLPDHDDAIIARRSLIYFWSVLMITITSNIHIVLLGLMRGNTEVGLFAAAWKLFNFTIVLPNLIATLFLPRIANLTTRPVERMRTTTIYMQTIIVSAVPITLFGSALIPQILTVLFGAPYLPATTTLGVLLVHGLVVSINIGFGTPLIAVGRQKTYLYIMTVGTAVGVVLNVALIPFLGAEGAALATVADELVILMLFVRSAPEVSVSHTTRFGARCLIAAIPAAVVVHFASMLPVIDRSDITVLVVGGSAGSIIYLLILRLVRIDIVGLAADLRHLH
jgi:O-antigen/teichoic acid export membrane protein